MLLFKFCPFWPMLLMFSWCPLLWANYLISSRGLKTFCFVSTLEDKHSTASEQSRMWWRLSEQHCLVLGSALEFFFNVFITWDEIFNSFQSWMFTGLQVGEWTVARAFNLNFLFSITLCTAMFWDLKLKSLIWKVIWKVLQSHALVYIGKKKTIAINIHADLIKPARWER